MAVVKMVVGKDTEHIPGYVLWQVAKLWQRKLNEALKALQLSSTQAVILINIPRLTKERQDVTQTTLSHVTKVDRTTVSQSIRSLEKKELIRRIVPSDNRRAYHVELTETGRVIATQALNRIAEAHAAFFQQPQSDTDAFLAYMLNLIQANEGDLDEDER
jgi:DNA-binding MarR family transcriptional regulator